MSRNPLELFETKPNMSSVSVRLEKDLYLHYRHDLPGRLEAPNGFDYHLITFFLTNNKRQIIHLGDRKEYYGQMNRGEFYLYPAGVSGFTEWQAIDKTLHLIIKPSLLREIALKTECLNPDCIELLPVLKDKDFQIEHLMGLFFAEMQNDSFGSQLYLESLANVLTVHLLRNYSVVEPVFRKYTNGLAPKKLRQTTDYIQSNLDRKLSLETMAAIVNMDKYYFATQFKKAMGISPYQYVIEQRVEKAKRLLHNQQQSLVKIASECGFASQSHFNKVFRQYVGTTPKSYQKQF